MNKARLEKVFEEIRNNTDMDYVIFDTTEEFGDTPSVVMKSIGDKFGYNATGIFLKHWEFNGSESWATSTEEYINHDITEEQAETVIKIFEENGYEITPKFYDFDTCFCVREKA